MTSITSASNPRAKQVVKLQRSSAERRDSHRFCIERTRELDRALDAGFSVHEVYASEAGAALPAVSRAVTTGAALVTVSAGVLEKMSYQENPQGFVAVAETRHRSLTQLKGPGGFYVVCSGVEKPGNVGAIVRSADAAGASGVIVYVEHFDLFNPNCIRASTGTVFSMPIACAARETLLDWLRANDVRIVAASPEAAEPYTRTDLTGGLALVVGAEAEGLDSAWREAADVRVSIPMRGTADSLNVSVTAALLLFEALRQREQS